MNLETMTTEEKHEALEAMCETLGMIESQHNAEVAGYGDSWPGAQIQIHELKVQIAEIEASLPPMPAPEPATAGFDDDLPF